MDLEELELELIDAGLEEIDLNEDSVYVYGDYTDFGNLSEALEKLNITPEKSNLEYISNSPIQLTEEQMEDVEKLIDKLEDDDDVQAVFTNID
jgi:transcriptional/translational regulatory protein YebC/TACO1